MGQRSATIDRDAPSLPLADPGLRPATAEDIGRLKAVMAEAFFEDPIYSWLMPVDTKRPARLLYERLGFQLIRELRVGSCPPLRLMLRPSTPSGMQR
jgi:hypothetical protein